MIINKTWPQIKYLGAQWMGLSEGRYSRGWKLRNAVRDSLGRSVALTGTHQQNKSKNRVRPRRTREAPGQVD